MPACHASWVGLKGPRNPTVQMLPRNFGSWKSASDVEGRGLQETSSACGHHYKHRLENTAKPPISVQSVASES
jgi:hypothetical protein